VARLGRSRPAAILSAVRHFLGSLLAVALFGAGVLAAAHEANGALAEHRAGGFGSERRAEPAPERVLAPPPGKRVYHAAYPDFGDAEQRVRAARIKRFERLARKRVAWVYFSNNWWRGRINFPAKQVRTIARLGRVPFVRLMARSNWENGPDPNFATERIASGEYDDALERWCARAAEAMARYDTPMLAEFGTEVNGDWFPWNGRWNGGGLSDGFGDPTVPDGPERFVAAYRRIVEICRAEGAGGITWFFHVNSDDSPREAWNTYAAYYPGDEYVDWIGVSAYGLLKLGWGSRSFRRTLDRAYPKLAALSPTRPLAVLEYGHAETKRPGRKARWLRRALRSVASGRWPRLRALSIWHESWRNGDGTVSNLHIDTSSRSLRAYRRGVHHPRFTGRARFVAR